MVDSMWYPSVEDAIAIHDDIVSEYTETDQGIQNRGDIEFVLNYIEQGSFGTKPETVQQTRMINTCQHLDLFMSTDDTTDARSPLDEVMDDIRRELVQRVAAADRESNREIYDALEHE